MIFKKKDKNDLTPIHIIGGGLAGSEAAWQIARLEIPVILYEMRPITSSPAHQTSDLAELVCSNSMRSDDADYNAVGLLHEEMRASQSLILSQADRHRVPAGSALAVDREAFSKSVTDALKNNPYVTLCRQEITDLEEIQSDSIIISTGPLTSPALAEKIEKLTGQGALSFFDAIAPIVYKNSIDFSQAWFQSRYDKGEGSDYINLPLTEEQYNLFVSDLVQSEKKIPKEWENIPYFEGCLPLEVMAERGRDTLAYGPLKPIGLTNPHNPTVKPYAIVQLRQDNCLGTLYNMVGFQTRMTYGEQTRIFRKIPGLENAEFARLGGIHKNSFIKSPLLLDSSLRLKSSPRFRFAGQITGCEGYVESAAIGLLAGLFAATERREGTVLAPPPQTTALGALLNHLVCGAHPDSFQPMNVNFGLFPDLTDDRDEKGKKVKGRDRKKLYAMRARQAIKSWLSLF
jgi:methylenetetrahydrofolate--tRNA-(uracil-5-)-methyltransferase